MCLVMGIIIPNLLRVLFVLAEKLHTYPECGTLDQSNLNPDLLLISSGTFGSPEKEILPY